MIGGILLQSRPLRLTALGPHCQDPGLNAVPIGAPKAFPIGVVLAFQGPTRMQQFKADMFVVDPDVITVLRELGSLMTAMHVLGLAPVAASLVPWVMALVVMLPALGFIADMAGLMGGALMARIDLGVSSLVFRSRLLANIIGCPESMSPGGGAESLGQRTCPSVVLSHLRVIVTYAIFSAFVGVKWQSHPRSDHSSAR